MIIHGEKEEVFGNSDKKTSFKISASAKAFKILSSNIYKNKIRAVVRELVCNAVDAHVLNSNKKPYIVKAPNQIDPRFIVRDFGPGLSDEDMVELYTTYFASTKAERNDQIGALGLGSKSPFSYTPTFSVTSYHDGWVRSYQCMLSNGEPSIVKTFEGIANPEDEPGIEVVVPAKLEDISLWHREIGYIMRPFKSGTYEIQGSVIQVNSFDKIEGYNDDWFIHSGCSSESKFYAIYGNIVYPLSDVEGLKTDWLNCLNKNIYFHFAPGTLDFQPSREELSLDPRTVNEIMIRLNNLNIQKQKNDLKILNEIENPRELSRQIAAMHHASLNVLTQAGYKIKDQLINKWTLLDPRVDMNLYELIRTTNFYGASTVGSVLRKSPRFKSSHRLVSNFAIETWLNFKTKKLFILELDDKKRPTQTILGLWADEKPNHPTRKDIVMVVNPGDGRHEKLVKLLKDIMEDDEVIMLKSSECEESRKMLPGYGEKKSVAKREWRPKSPNAIEYVLGQYGFSHKDLYLTASEIEKLDSPVVGMHRDDICPQIYDYARISNWNIEKVKNMARRLKIEKFVVVRPSIQVKVKTLGLECLVEKFLNEFKRLIDTVKQDNYYYEMENSNFFRNISRHEQLAEIRNEFVTCFNDDSMEINWWFEYMKKPYQMKHFDNIFDISTLIETYNERIEIAKADSTERLKAFIEKYFPLYYYMNDRRYMDEERIDTIAKQFAFLKSNGY